LDSIKKQEKIVAMFDDIAQTYDLANRVLSFGIDKRWRKKGCLKAFSYLNKDRVSKIVDVATGTGDLLLYWKKIADQKGISVDSFIGIDPSSKMLEIAKKKVDFADFILGKAQELPLEDKSADIISISYGIRNVVDRMEAIKEFYRVLKKDGILVILEFTKPQEEEGILIKFRDWYMKNLLPIIGGLVSKNYAAYKYLPSSIEEFLTTQKLLEELESVGFKRRYVKSFSLGISTLLIVQKG